MFLFPTIPCFFYVLNDNIRTIWSINDWASTKWARGNRHASRAETLILGGFAGLYEENEVVF